MKPVINRVLLDTKTDVSTTASANLKGTGLLETTHYIDWATGVTSGAIQIETASSTSYAGTWAPYGDPIAFSGTAPKADYVRVQGCYNAIRHRISTAVAGGSAPSVTTRIVGSK